ncbi:hypothetical protein L1987_17490 [Smallanthus sonchifolius]|uniref:Uncharacterized protein n=1 Tax=Smallanthus sonchifolius TaxID=185202 RepID=A0ACB9IZ80_9ASTR|nr:hypothetical protein L1987_17490 [Smallanthus sonchifolius]
MKNRKKTYIFSRLPITIDAVSSLEMTPCGLPLQLPLLFVLKPTINLHNLGTNYLFSLNSRITSWIKVG